MSLFLALAYCLKWRLKIYVLAGFMKHGIEEREVGLPQGYY